MLVRNHFNEEVEIKYLKRMKKTNSVFYFIVKARLENEQGEYWNYKDFQEYNPDFDWSKWD